MSKRYNPKTAKLNQHVETIETKTAVFPLYSTKMNCSTIWDFLYFYISKLHGVTLVLYIKLILPYSFQTNQSVKKNLKMIHHYSN